MGQDLKKELKLRTFCIGQIQEKQNDFIMCAVCIHLHKNICMFVFIVSFAGFFVCSEPEMMASVSQFMVMYFRNACILFSCASGKIVSCSTVLF